MITSGLEQAGDVLQPRQTQERETQKTHPFQFLPHQVPDCSSGMSRQFQPHQDRQPSPGPRPWRKLKVTPGWEQSGDTSQPRQTQERETQTTLPFQFSPQQVPECSPGMSRQFEPQQDRQSSAVLWPWRKLKVTLGWDQAGATLQPRQTQERETQTTLPFQFSPHHVPECSPGMSRQFEPHQDRQPSPGPRPWGESKVTHGMINTELEQAGDTLQSRQAKKTEGPSALSFQVLHPHVPECSPGPSRQFDHKHQVPENSLDVSEDSSSDLSITKDPLWDPRHLEHMLRPSPFITESLEDVENPTNNDTSVSESSKSTVRKKRQKKKNVEFHKPKQRKKKPTAPSQCITITWMSLDQDQKDSLERKAVIKYK